MWNDKEHMFCHTKKVWKKVGTYFAPNIMFVLFFVFVKFHANNKLSKSIIQLPCCPKTLTKLYWLSVEERQLVTVCVFKNTQCGLELVCPLARERSWQWQ